MEYAEVVKDIKEAVAWCKQLDAKPTRIIIVWEE